MLFTWTAFEAMPRVILREDVQCKTGLRYGPREPELRISGYDALDLSAYSNCCYG